MSDSETVSRDRGSARPRTIVADSPLKRRFDMTAAAMALIVLAPTLLLVALAIWLEDRGPVLFRQTRTGLNGAPFVILKFRSMTAVQEGGDVRQATKGDQRITRIIRALSIDELPQLVNVLKGDMSLIGPRPHALSHDASWSRLAPSYALRFRARPGLTGYAQVLGYRGELHGQADLRRRIEADNYYIDHWTPALDWSILWRTVLIIFRDPKAY
jgi:putative colanic acid biosynthesis UDP-glucose lipid carrier transferase